eukprot:GHVP01047422.1.p1 GENE.GHVP01047422.1~~GHVP01047422.1.p1  ORF type:complete len:184 (+),score=33.83 GHVP01047422.1:19-570(+)
MIFTTEAIAGFPIAGMIRPLEEEILNNFENSINPTEVESYAAPSNRRRRSTRREVEFGLDEDEYAYTSFPLLTLVSFVVWSGITIYHTYNYRTLSDESFKNWTISEQTTKHPVFHAILGLATTAWVGYEEANQGNPALLTEFAMPAQIGLTLSSLILAATSWSKESTTAERDEKIRQSQIAIA